MQDICYDNWRRTLVLVDMGKFGIRELNITKLDNNRSVFKMAYQDIDITNDIIAFVYNNPMKNSSTLYRL